MATTGRASHLGKRKRRYNVFELYMTRVPGGPGLTLGHGLLSCAQLHSVLLYIANSVSLTLPVLNMSGRGGLLEICICKVWRHFSRPRHRRDYKDRWRCEGRKALSHSFHRNYWPPCPEESLFLLCLTNYSLLFKKKKINVSRNFVLNEKKLLVVFFFPLKIQYLTRN